MGTSYGNIPIVTSGLTLCLDAGNLKSYPTSGTTWTDLSKNGYNGTLVNSPTFSSSNVGSLVFNGSTQYIITNNPFNLPSSTWSAWFRPTSTSLSGGVARRILHKSSNTGTNEINIAHSSGNIFFAGYLTSSYSWVISVSGISINNWFNIVGTYNGTNVFLYLNGQLVGSTTQSGVIPDANINLYIGRVGFTDVGSFEGGISQVLIYNRALSSSEVLQNYNATKWRFQ